MDVDSSSRSNATWATVFVGLGMASLGLVLVLVGQWRFAGTDAGSGLTQLGSLMAFFPLVWIAYRLSGPKQR